MGLISLLDNDIDEILKDIVAQMKIEVCVSSTVVIDSGSFKLNTCNTQYLRKCSRIDVNGIEYVVDEFVQDEYLILKGSPIITECFELPSPYYLTGSPIMTSTELSQVKSDLSRHPFIWLLEVFSTDYNANSDNPIASTSRLRLFLFDYADDEHWLNSDHRVNVLRPMRSLGDLLLSNIQNDKRVVDLNNYSVYDRPDFGNYQVNKGNISSILPESLSGIELIVEIPIFEQENCKKKSNCK